MSFQRPTLETLVSRIKQDLEGRLGTAGAVLRRAVLAVLAKVYAGAVHLLHGHLEYVSEQVFPDTAIASNLERWSSIWGVARVPAAYADGNVTATGTNGTVIPSGTRLIRADDVEYETTAEATVALGTATLAVRAVVAGVDGNADAAVQLTLVTPIAGVNSVAVVASGDLTGGADEETDDSLRDRLLLRIQQPALGGAISDYERWAREVAGVTRVWAFEEYLGEGTVGVTFVRDNDADIIPEAGEVQDVQDYIDAVRPVTAHVTVFAPTEDPIDLNISLTPNTEAVKAAVEAQLIDLIYRDGYPGSTILLSRINEAISIAAGESDHVLTVPSANHVSGAGELPVLGTITWA